MELRKVADLLQELYPIVPESIEVIGHWKWSVTLFARLQDGRKIQVSCGRGSEESYIQFDSDGGWESWLNMGDVSYTIYHLSSNESEETRWTLPLDVKWESIDLKNKSIEDMEKLFPITPQEDILIKSVNESIYEVYVRLRNDGKFMKILAEGYYKFSPKDDGWSDLLDQDNDYFISV